MTVKSSLEKITQPLKCAVILHDCCEYLRRWTKSDSQMDDVVSQYQKYAKICVDLQESIEELMGEDYLPYLEYLKGTKKSKKGKDKAVFQENRLEWFISHLRQDLNELRKISHFKE
jgi:hypothetical protein